MYYTNIKPNWPSTTATTVTGAATAVANQINLADPSSGTFALTIPLAASYPGAIIRCPSSISMSAMTDPKAREAPPNSVTSAQSAVDATSPWAHNTVFGNGRNCRDLSVAIRDFCVSSKEWHPHQYLS